MLPWRGRYGHVVGEGLLAHKVERHLPPGCCRRYIGRHHRPVHVLEPLRRRQRFYDRSNAVGAHDVDGHLDRASTRGHGTGTDGPSRTDCGGRRGVHRHRRLTDLHDGLIKAIGQRTGERVLPGRGRHGHVVGEGLLAQKGERHLPPGCCRRYIGRHHRPVHVLEPLRRRQRFYDRSNAVGAHDVDGHLDRASTRGHGTGADGPSRTHTGLLSGRLRGPCQPYDNGCQTP